MSLRSILYYTLWQGLGRGAEVGGAPLQHRPPAVQPPRPPLHPLQGAQPQEFTPTPGPLKSMEAKAILSVEQKTSCSSVFQGKYAPLPPPHTLINKCWLS